MLLPFLVEIRKATGTHSILEFEACSECILFTTNKRILGLIEKYDTAYQKYSQGFHFFSECYVRTCLIFTYCQHWRKQKHLTID